jgi:hypothetical protein
MPIETKTDADWYQLMSQTSVTAPMWFLFGKNGSLKTEASKDILEEISVLYPQINFYFFDMDQSPGAKSVSSVDREGTNILYMFGMEFSRFRSVDETVYIQRVDLLIENFNNACNPTNLIEEIEWSGSSHVLTNGSFEIKSADIFEWSGTNPTLTDGTFEIIPA